MILDIEKFKYCFLATIIKMAYPQPVYKECFDLSKLKYQGKRKNAEKLDFAADGILEYMRTELFMTCSIEGIGEDYVTQYSGLTKNGSLVILKGIDSTDRWQTANVTVVNMQEKDDGLLKLLKKVAIESAKN
jgi:hypothetical protein